MFSNVKQMASSIRSTIREARRKVISDDAVPRFKESFREASQELFGSSKNKDIESTLSFRTTDSKTKETPDETDKAKEYTGPSALVAVKEQENAWDRIGARLKEAPIIQGILDAARQAADTRAGQKLGQGAKMAKDKIGDATEDAREFWETSQNPYVYKNCAPERE